MRALLIGTLLLIAACGTKNRPEAKSFPLCHCWNIEKCRNFYRHPPPNVRMSEANVKAVLEELDDFEVRCADAFARFFL
jgi:hypothetical protein